MHILWVIAKVFFLLSLVPAVAVLALSALVASLIPAHRASSVNPVQALSAE